MRTACPVLLLSLLIALFVPPAAGAQNTGSWWGSAGWFDWSDFRAEFGVRLFLARLQSASFTVEGQEINLLGDEFDLGEDDLEPIREVWGTLYIDRLGIRFSYFAPHDVFSFKSVGPPIPLPTRPNVTLNPVSLSELELGPGRFGLDIDVLRYPFARLGFNIDYQLEPVRFYDRRDPVSVRFFEGTEAITVGLHGSAIPLRVRDIPIILRGRVNIPHSVVLPFLERDNEGRIFEWEISGGLRPAIWETSLYAHSTFSAFIEVGFRQTQADFSVGDGAVEFKALWDGAFFQIGATW